MIAFIDALRRVHDGFFNALDRATDRWFFSLLARFVFASTLYIYYLNSAKTKIGDGLFGFLHITDGAYIQIVGPAFEAAGYDSSALPLPAHIMVVMGTYGEFIMPVLVILGLFSRIGAAGLIVFILVQTYVDATAHQVVLGALINGQPSEILDQRLYWIVPLVYVMLKGGGTISLDTLLSRWWDRRLERWETHRA